LDEVISIATHDVTMESPHIIALLGQASLALTNKVFGVVQVLSTLKDWLFQQSLIQVKNGNHFSR